MWDFFKAPKHDGEQFHQAWSLHIVLWTVLAAVTVMCVVDILTLPKNTLRWIGVIVFLDSACLLLIYANHRGHTRLASIAAVVMFWLLVTVLIATENTLRAPGAPAYLLIIFTAGLLLGTRAGVLTGIVCALTTTVFVVLESRGYFHKSAVEHTMAIYWFTQLFLMVMILSLQWLANRSVGMALRRAERELEVRKQTEETLRESEQRYREVFENTSDLIFLMRVEPDGTFRYARFNKAYEKLLNVSLAAIEGKTPDEALPPEIREDIKRRYRECLAKKEPISYEAMRELGQVRYQLFSTLIPLANPEGRIDRIIGVAHNITERKRHEEQLRESEERYRIVVEQTGQMVYDHDIPTGKIKWQGAITQLTGYSARAFQSVGLEEWKEMIHPDDRHKTVELLEKAMNRCGSYRAGYRFRRQDNSCICVDDHGVCVCGSSGKPVRILGTMTDITARKHAEEENAELTRSLEQRVRERTAELETANQELESFSYSVSHDLRGPLRAILGFSGILLAKLQGKIAPEPAGLLAGIETSADRMNQLINDLLKLARVGRQPLNTAQVDVQGMVSRMVREMREAEKDREIKVTVGTLPPCRGDASLIEQVFVNLLSNAFKFTRQRPVAEIEINAEQRGSEIQYFVRDNGAGFDMQNEKKLFAPFERMHTAAEFEGTGIGLSIVKRIILRHGGRIWAESVVDHGTTFTLTLPAVESSLNADGRG